nr:enolase C-terminal domain-like protein [Planosporangium mesophilum]
MVEEALELRERCGFNTFKVKVGKDVGTDIRAVRGLRAALGADVELYVDANKGWSADDAIRVLPVMREVGVTMLEEPTPAFEPLARRRVAAASEIPILGDESVTRLGEVAREILDNHSQLISIKVARTGFTESERIVGLCEGLGVGMAMGSQMDGMVGTLATLAFGAAFRSTSLRAGELDYFMQLTDDLLTEPLVVTDGQLRVPGKPGIGIEIDEAKLAHYRIDTD